jgi:hypothetical protein
MTALDDKIRAAALRWMDLDEIFDDGGILAPEEDRQLSEYCRDVRVIAVEHAQETQRERDMLKRLNERQATTIADLQRELKRVRSAREKIAEAMDHSRQREKLRSEPPPARSTALHVFSDGTDTVVAASLEDALAVWTEHAGEREDDMDPFELVPDEKPLTITDADDGTMETKTAGQWADDNGRGFMCSTEW